MSLLSKIFSHFKVKNSLSENREVVDELMNDVMAEMCDKYGEICDNLVYYYRVTFKDESSRNLKVRMFVQNPETKEQIYFPLSVLKDRGDDYTLYLQEQNYICKKMCSPSNQKKCVSYR